MAIDEWDGADEDPDTPWGNEGLRWAVYFDKDDNGLKGRHKGRDMFEISLKRRIQSAEEQLKQNEAAEKKMQVKSRGGLSTQFAAPQKERDKEWEKKFGEKARLELEKKLAKDQPHKAEQIYKDILSKPPGSNERAVHGFENALIALGELYRDLKKTQDLANLVQQTRDVLTSFARAKTAKLGMPTWKEIRIF